MCPHIGRTTCSDSDRCLGGHPIRLCYAKDLQDGLQMMALGNGPKRD